MIKNIGQLVLSYVSPPIMVLGILANLGDWKSFVLFLLGLAMGITRLYFSILKQIDERKKRRIHLDSAIIDLNVKKRENENIS